LFESQCTRRAGLYLFLECRDFPYKPVKAGAQAQSSASSFLAPNALRTAGTHTHVANGTALLVLLSANFRVVCLSISTGACLVGLHES
jgi:hypothetical protein